MVNIIKAAAVKYAGYIIEIIYVRPDEPQVRPLADVVFFAGQEIIHRNDLVTGIFGQLIGQVTGNEPGAAGD